ncbi:MAG: glycoside hydrolase family 3 C-terminal domain-containing protein [Lachnospiraceae bacterium]|nr:glycoside hydrolase family 3 C-terminal domain-containing protein [Lachnospiraceae bacterium]
MELLTKASYSGEMSEREKKNLKVAYKAACESIVLLKNEKVLPLKNKKVALYGPGVTRTIKGGTGSGEVNERHSITILEGMENRGFEVTTKKWIEDYEASYEAGEIAHNKDQRNIFKMLKAKSFMGLMFKGYTPPAGRAITQEDIIKSDTDTAIYVLSRQAGEGGDRKAEKGDLYITDEERDAISTCVKNYKNFVLVINSGCSIDMSFVNEIHGIGAILFICQLGTEGGNAFADTVSGKVTPSGKLTDTWAKQYADIPFYNEYSYLNGNVDDEYYKEGIYVGYRYFDSFGVEPCYPFGYGLSYTEFSIFSSGVQIDKTKVYLDTTVTNIGGIYSGKEVVQVYVSAPNGKLDKEYQSLAAFAKTKELAPGESEILRLSFDMADLSSYDEKRASYVLDAGEYIVRLGNSSRSTVAVAVVTLDEEVVVSKHCNVCPMVEEMEELKSSPKDKEEVNPGVPRLVVKAEDFETKTYQYETPAIYRDEKVDAFVNSLTIKEMVEIVVGIGMFGGETRFNMPGSVGNTTSKFWDRGLANVTLCDGPAGLRITKRAVVQKNGTLKPVELPISVFEMFPEFIQNFMKADPEKGTVVYQYTTAFPVTAALAQSWNVELLEEVGKAIFLEMKEYGCTFWLAPAVNIHRNPLCGRNFEYVSEDPFLTGEVAAAITKGIQQEEGYYATVKHFACNNMEENRNRVSSNLSERTLREIYLRGFERAVRKGHAKAIMTSYNRINSCYAPNSYDLCTKVLRNEWGFDGVVMTDWFSTNRGFGNNALAMKAGNDLIMPGGGSYKKEILSGVKSGMIQEDDVRRCCANVVRAIMDSSIQKEYIEK